MFINISLQNTFQKIILLEKHHLNTKSGGLAVFYYVKDELTVQTQSYHIKLSD